MKNIFCQLAKNRTKTVLTVVVALVMAFTASALFSTAFMNNGRQEGNVEITKESFSQSEESANGNNLNSTDTTKQNENSDVSDNTNAKQNGKESGAPSDLSNAPAMQEGNLNMGAQNQNSTAVYILIAVCAVGAILIVVITSMNARKRRKILPLNAEGIVDNKDIKALKKSVALEVIITVMIAAVAGTGAGLAASQPIQNAYMNKQSDRIQMMKPDDITDNESTTQTEETTENDSQSDSFSNGAPSAPNGDMKKGAPSGNNGSAYLYSALFSLLICFVTALLAIVAGQAALPLNCNDDDDEEDDDE